MPQYLVFLYFIGGTIIKTFSVSTLIILFCTAGVAFADGQDQQIINSLANRDDMLQQISTKAKANSNQAVNQANRNFMLNSTSQFYNDNWGNNGVNPTNPIRSNTYYNTGASFIDPNTGNAWSVKPQ